MDKIIPVEYDYFREYAKKDEFGNDVYSEWYDRAFKKVSEVTPGTKIIHNGKVVTFKSYEMDINSLRYKANYTYDSHYDYDCAECSIKVYVEENEKPFIENNSEDFMKYGWGEEDRYLKFKNLADSTPLRLYTVEDELNTLSINISKKLKKCNLQQLQKIDNFISNLREE